MQPAAVETTASRLPAPPFDEEPEQNGLFPATVADNKPEPRERAQRWSVHDPEIEELENRLAMLDANDYTNRSMIEFKIADLKRRRRWLTH